MYKILIKLKDSNTKPLFTIHKTEQEVIVTPEVIDETSGEIITPAKTETQLLDWSCETTDELANKVDELLNEHPITNIVPFKVVEVDAIVDVKDSEEIGS